MTEVCFQHKGNHARYTGLRPSSIIAAFSYRSFYEENESLERDRMRERFVQEMGISPAFTAGGEQVHGGNIAVAAEGGIAADVDGVITRARNLFLTVVVADCLPIYLWDDDGKAVGLLHAGWRGTVAEIAVSGVEKFSDSLQIKPDKIHVLLGPCICQSCFEVGPEVAERFDSLCLRQGSADRMHLNLRDANYRQLIDAGVRSEMILSDKRCTNCNQELFFSYRRDGAGTGRMIAAIGLSI